MAPHLIFGRCRTVTLDIVNFTATSWCCDRGRVTSNIVVKSGSWFVNPGARDWACPPAPAEVAAFHMGLADYASTPLLDLPAFAAGWEVGRVVVKDESIRFGLPAFKALGVSYAIYRVICEHAGETVGPADWNGLRAVLASLPPLEVVTATDGNHGRAVARFARLLGIPAHVFVPDVVGLGAIAAIRAEQAEVTVVGDDYDATVRRAAEEAGSRPAAVLLQDTSWSGYERIPQWIVDGYSTMFAELDAQLPATEPALVVVPMGVGSLAHAVVTHYRSRDHEQRAVLLGVEPDTAACIQTSLSAGRSCAVPTGSTIMAGLNCGTPSSLAWPYLRDGLDAAIAVSDEQAADAARELDALGVSSGPCGAATLAAARAALAEPGSRADLGVSPDTTVVLLNTEGAHEESNC
ncbi:diaminopropionate ammonia-lyase [Saccharopolyspora shandongensis]|uniref:diaminopropionate ammonia-lyase n=1 Tax=Saccharopolyspora shandongensis TaxID=418495 RepID=UPI000B89D8FA|nr:diaminopropionate ammonia-lyase [Saccharopolyspora shandongensis]